MQWAGPCKVKVKRQSISTPERVLDSSLAVFRAAKHKAHPSLRNLYNTCFPSNVDLCRSVEKSYFFGLARNPDGSASANFDSLRRVDLRDDRGEDAGGELPTAFLAARFCSGDSRSRFGARLIAPVPS